MKYRLFFISHKKTLFILTRSYILIPVSLNLHEFNTSTESLNK